MRLHQAWVDDAVVGCLHADAAVGLLHHDCEDEALVDSRLGCYARDGSLDVVDLGRRVVLEAELSARSFHVDGAGLEGSVEAHPLGLAWPACAGRAVACEHLVRPGTTSC